MEARAQQGYLILADISGFTSFMASAELEHAHAIVGELLELIVKRFSPLLILVEFELKPIPNVLLRIMAAAVRKHYGVPAHYVRLAELLGREQGADSSAAGIPVAAPA
jgi:hypothetical protein